MRPGLPDIPFRPTVPELLRRAVDRFGDDDYVVERDRRLSFREAETRSAALARRLLDGGVGKGTRVGILLPTGIEWAVTFLACARVGALAMLFPATYKPGELRRSLRIGDVALLVAARTIVGRDTEPELEAAIPSLASHAGGPLRDLEVPYLRAVWMVGGSQRPWAVPVDVDAAGDAGDAGDAGGDGPLLAAVEQEVSPADPLLVIYTSGSSADPKAVVHTQGATVRKVQGELGVTLQASFPGRVFSAMPFFWVGGPQLLLGALHSGAAIVVQERFDAPGALDLLERERCTAIVGWPTVLEQIQSLPDYGERDLALTYATAITNRSSRGDPPNVGMTETFGPHANREWFDYKIVDPSTGATLDEGEEGEFCVRGFGLMAGLYKREREETFDADGYYHTGDRGYVEGGTIWFTGRSSEMIKSGGANVSPLEVEMVLASFPDVRAAFVLGLPDEQRGETVAAVIVPRDGAALDGEVLRERLRRELSSYKVPTRWLITDDESIPRLASGKPDKRTLRERLLRG